MMWWVVVPFGAVALAITLLNLMTWRRGRPDHRTDTSVSVLIPARNEEATIAASVRAAFASSHDVLEVVVYEDGSTDDTARILQELGEEFGERLRVVPGHGLPAGWVGKPHACHQLSKLARGDVLLFVDADTTLQPGGVARVLSLLDRLRLDLLTAVPRQRTETFWEHTVLPLLHLTYTSWLPMLLVHNTRNTSFLAANGQILAMRRSTRDTLDGFAGVQNEVVDDMALCRLAKQQGLRVAFADGHRIATCRMYTSFGEIWEGFSKNLYEGLGERSVLLLGVITVYGMAFIAPYVALAAGLAGAPGALLPGLVGVGLNLAVRVLLAARWGHRLWSVLLHPLAVLVLIGIAVNSWRWSRRGTIHWRGRTYASRSARTSAKGS